jgi:hypothetical protein
MKPETETRIAQLMADVARLSNQVVDLQNERDELVAQVENIRKIFPLNFLVGCEGYLNYPITQYNKVVDCFNETPAQCLRDIQAEAALAGFYEGIKYGGDRMSDEYIDEVAEQYAAKVREVGNKTINQTEGN